MLTARGLLTVVTMVKCPHYQVGGTPRKLCYNHHMTNHDPTVDFSHEYYQSRAKEMVLMMHKQLKAFEAYNTEIAGLEAIRSIRSSKAIAIAVGFDIQFDYINAVNNLLLDKNYVPAAAIARAMYENGADMYHIFNTNPLKTDERAAAYVTSIEDYLEHYTSFVPSSYHDTTAITEAISQPKFWTTSKIKHRIEGAYGKLGLISYDFLCFSTHSNPVSFLSNNNYRNKGYIHREVDKYTLVSSTVLASNTIILENAIQLLKLTSVLFKDIPVYKYDVRDDV